jgi:transposase-like protein
MDSPDGAKMREELFMTRRKRRKFTPEFKADAVKLVSGRAQRARRHERARSLR